MEWTPGPYIALSDLRPEKTKWTCKVLVLYRHLFCGPDLRLYNKFIVGDNRGSCITILIPDIPTNEWLVDILEIHKTFDIGQFFVQQRILLQEPPVPLQPGLPRFPSHLSHRLLLTFIYKTLKRMQICT